MNDEREKDHTEYGNRKERRTGKRNGNRGGWTKRTTVKRPNPLYKDFLRSLR